jgi:CMP-N-acetylneuraminic acid synthetase/spore coat polysaccharide biosynthesis predicted glycosyltransferase SpsG
MKVLVVIPARGGSKGIPRKNLRNLAGKPLLSYSVHTAMASRYCPDIFVSTDDEEIAAIARKLGARTIERDPAEALDQATLDPVIYSALQSAIAATGVVYDLVVTLQPTSPLLKTSSLDNAIGQVVADHRLDTVISARDDTHLTWRKEGGVFTPNYRARVNRQYLEPVFRETGGFLVTRAGIVSPSSRIGQRVELCILGGGEEIDIDTYEDWGLCEYYLKRKKILFVVAGSPEVGLGHVYNTLLLANDILNHQIEFLVDSASDLAFDAISSRNYPVFKQAAEDIVDDIRLRGPDVVINDRLDTDADYVKRLADEGYRVINFEDLGEGARFADMVINAIYPEKTVLPRHYFGHDYFILRDEFALTPSRATSLKVKQVLLTFGGVDPNNFSLKVLEAIYSYCLSNSIGIDVVAGFGYTQYDTLERFGEARIYRNSMDIAGHMRSADVIFTSGGRTTYEVAALAVPTVVLAQNERETTHFFASADNGFLNLGLGINVLAEEILSAFQGLAENYETRKHIRSIMAAADLVSGRQRVIRLINDVVEGRV